MTLLDPAERHASGMAIGEAVIGRHLPAPATLYEESWRDFVFAEVWSRPGLDRRARYLVAIAGATLCGGTEPHLEAYVFGALHSGNLSQAELREAALHLSVYGGWSRGAELDRAITRAEAELGLPAVASPPLRGAPWDPAQRTAEGQAGFTDVMTFPGGPSATPFMEAINNFVFGEMWGRYAGLDQRSRRWLTLVGVCESCADIPIKSHVHAAMASGNCTAAEMQEFVLAYGIHAGWPKASRIQGVVFEMTRKVELGLGWDA